MKHITLINVERIAAHLALFILIIYIAGHITGILLH